MYSQKNLLDTLLKYGNIAVEYIWDEKNKRIIEKRINIRRSMNENKIIYTERKK